MKKYLFIALLAPVCMAKDIVFTYVKSPLNVPSIVEKQKQIFAKHFAPDTVRYSELTAGPKQTAALASGDIDFLFAVGATSVFLAANSGLDIKIINAYSRAPEAYELIAKKPLASLKGAKIAGPKGTILHELLLAYLKTQGLSANDVQFMSMDIPAAASALAAGSIDVALLAGPAAYAAKQNGMHSITSAKGVILPLVVNATKASQDPALVAKFKAAQAEILEFMKEHESEAKILSQAATQLSAAAVEQMYKMYDFSSQITAKDLASMHSTIDFMLEQKMISQPINPQDLMY